MENNEKKWFKILVNGRSCHGGNMEWSLPKDGQPGDWHEVDGNISICCRGLHFTSAPARWWKDGAKAYEAEIGEIIETDDSDFKCVVRRARLLREVSIEELFEHLVFAEGEHTINDGYAVAFGSSTVRAFGSSTVEAFGSSTVEASGSSTVRAFGSSTVEAFGSSTVRAFGSSTVRAFGSSTVEAFDSSTVEASGSSTVRASGSSTVRASGSSTVEASGSSTVRAFGSSTVRASGSSTVRASGSSTVVSPRWSSAKVGIDGDAVHVDRSDGKPKVYILRAKREGEADESD